MLRRTLPIVLVAITCTSLPALAQRGPVGVGLEVHGANFSTATGAYTDPAPDSPRNIAHGSLNNVSRGAALEGRFSVRLPWGVRPYVGYHVGRPRENAPNQDLWRAIYHNGIPDFESAFREQSHTVEIRTEGWSGGLMYEPHWLDWAVRPYLFGEIRTESFRAETDLTGVVDHDELPELTDAPFEGHSVLVAETVYRYGVGLGARIAMSRFGTSMPFGALSLVPELKYVSAPGAQL